jgi:tRNA (guanine-N7-)-methyltransferase
VDNPARTVEHRERLAQRRETLQTAFAKIFQPGTTAFTWEIGCGHGHFLTAYAQTHPEKLCVGIDLASDRIARAIRKRDRARLADLHFIQAEARFFLEALPPEVRFSDVFILFPDPWPKLRHHKHRILQPAFLDAVANRMGEGARLLFRTDHEPYFQDAVAVVDAHRAWRRVEEPWPFEFETVFQSRAPSYHSLIARLAVGHGLTS